MLVRQLADLAFGYGGHGTMIVLKASFDGSGKEDDHPVITVGGFCADDRICQAIQADWINATGGKVFHLAEFGTDDCELGSKEWDREQRTTFLKRLGGIINRPEVAIISHSVEVSEYKTFLSGNQYADIWGPAYSALAALCAYATETILMSRGLLLEKLAYIFEKGEREHELAKTLTDFEKGRGWRYRDLRSHHFLPKCTTILQPADLIAGVVQGVLIRAIESIKCLDNGRPFTPIHNFERYYSEDGVTSSVIPGNSVVYRVVVNKPTFRQLNAYTTDAAAKYPGILDRRRKSKVNQGKRDKTKH
jgi:hypothetical protein